MTTPTIGATPLSAVKALEYIQGTIDDLKDIIAKFQEAASNPAFAMSNYGGKAMLASEALPELNWLKSYVEDSIEGRTLWPTILERIERKMDFYTERLLTTDVARHNSTNEFDNIQNIARVEAYQKMRRVLSFILDPAHPIARQFI